MRKLLTALAGAATMVAVSAPAAAAVVTTTTQTIAFGTHATEFDSSDAAQSYATQAFQLFNSNLGTLQSVAIRATYQENSNISIKNNSSTAQSGSVNSESRLYLSGSDNTQSAAISSLLTPGADGLKAIGSQTVFAGPTRIAGNATVNVTSNSGLVDSGYKSLTSDLAAWSFLGTAFSDIIADTFTTTTLSQSGGNLVATQSTTGTPTFFIYYTYDDSTATPPPSAVPEPATWAMMLAGFGAVGFALRRRKGVAVAFN